jgi:hypothetical protein
MTQSKNWRRLLEPDMLVAFSAMLVGTCALVVSIFEVRIMREEQRANAWPRVEAFVNTGSEFVMRLTNKGFGPAMIQGVVVTLDGQPIKDWHQIMIGIFGDSTDFTQAKITDTVLAPQDNLEIFKPSSSDSASARVLSDSTGRIGIQICYCSVYDDCWWLRRPSFAGGSRWTHEEVKVCTISDTDQFRM